MHFYFSNQLSKLKTKINQSEKVNSQMKKYKICVVISAEDLDSHRIAGSIFKTISSLEDQGMSVKNDMQIFMLLSENDNSKNIGEIFTRMFPANYTVNVIYDMDYNRSIKKCIGSFNADYITFIHAGDVFSKKALKKVYSYFEFAKGNVDVVGVKILNKDKLFADYNKSFVKTAYNLHFPEKKTNHPCIINGLFIKSAVAKDKIKLQEQHFSTDVFMIDVLNRRNILGVMDNSVSITLDNESIPVYSMHMFEENLNEFLEMLNRIYDNQGFIPSYIQNFTAVKILRILNNSEKIMEVYQPPVYDYSDVWNKLSQVLKYVDDNIIMQKLTTRFNKLFLLSVKYESFCSFDKFLDDVVMFYKNTSTYKLSTFPARIELVCIKDGHLIVEGICHYPACIDVEKLKIKASINGRIIEAKQVKRYTDRYFYEKPYLFEKGFKLDIPLSDEKYEIEIVTEIDECKCFNRSLEYMELSVISDAVPESYYYKDGYSIQAESDKMICFACNNEMHTALEENLIHKIRLESENAEEIIKIRDFYQKNHSNKEKQIWLIMDRPDRADDNADVFFRYMVKRNEPDIDLYYVLSKESPSYREMCKIGKVIEPFSLQHRQLFVIADYVISSQMAQFVFNPFNSDIEYLRDLFRNPKHIFLQHGVIHNDHDRGINKYHRDFRAFITSATDEYNYLLSPKFHYTEKEMWLTGMPRFDLLYRDDKRKITIMPTWRKFLTTRVFDESKGTMIWKVNDNFTESEYFNFYNDLINNKKLLDAADKYGYHICFMPHVTFLKEADKFSQDGRVTIYNYDKSYREIYAESSLIVTDYSSAVFDFSYLRQPIIYSQFDFEKFYSDHTVRKGYFDFKRDGFGEVTENLEDTIHLIIDYMAHNCELKPKYRERIDSFFKFSDKNCSERIYKKIREIEEN